MNTVIGIDLGDKHHIAVMIDSKGKESKALRLPNTREGLQKLLGKHPGSTVVMEAGTHSPWISRFVEQCGCKAHVGQPRKIRAIWDADDKSDERDARMLARLYRFDPKMVPVVHHRGEQAQADLAVVKARSQLKSARQQLINHVRATVKSFGGRLDSCGAASFATKTQGQIPEALKPAMEGVYVSIETLSEQIRDLEHQIKRMCVEDYPETQWLMQVPGVGPMTALTYVLTLEDPDRFAKSREVGSFLGLTPRRDQSGQTDKQLRITKSGDKMLRCLLVNCVTHILKENSPDCELKRFGQRLSERGGKRGVKTAKVAMARKLSVMLHRLWKDRVDYRPFPTGKEAAAVAA
jgi:transposase